MATKIETFLELSEQAMGLTGLTTDNIETAKRVATNARIAVVNGELAGSQQAVLLRLLNESLGETIFSEIPARRINPRG